MYKYVIFMTIIVKEWGENEAIKEQNFYILLKVSCFSFPLEYYKISIIIPRATIKKIT